MSPNSLDCLSFVYRTALAGRGGQENADCWPSQLEFCRYILNRIADFFPAEIRRGFTQEGTGFCFKDLAAFAIQSPFDTTYCLDNILLVEKSDTFVASVARGNTETVDHHHHNDKLTI